ncbi:MAG TPA: hypothetical protein VI732_03640 [Alphaproteobacteria bacterium]|nr:hypothetical protein [Alphaproteobacteria bacterium]
MRPAVPAYQGKPAKPAPGTADQSGRRRAAAGRDGSNASVLLVMGFGLLAVSMVVALPTVPIVLLGMIPTAVALFVDRSPHKSAAICVAGLNFAGVAPFVAILWRGPNTLYHSISMLGDVYTWLAMYGAAAIGWILNLGLQPLAASMLRIRGAQQIASLRAQQAKLREDWGIGPAAAKR